MPLIDTGRHVTPYLAYDAPIDEKTKKIREMFKVDESGYPEHYKWRGMAKLGSSYNYDEPFEKFGLHNEDEDLSSKIVATSIIGISSFVLHYFLNTNQMKPFYLKLYQPLILTGVGSWLYIKILDRSHERSSMQNHTLVDYVRKHPERFGPKQRHKYREVLLQYVPCR